MSVVCVAIGPLPQAKHPSSTAGSGCRAATLGFLLSVPGQTMGMAVFAEAFIEVTGLTRTELSLAYMLGTISSAAFLSNPCVYETTVR